MRERVLIVDDHAAFRSWARVFLEAEGYDVVGEAEDGSSAGSGTQGFETKSELSRASLDPILGAAR